MNQPIKRIIGKVAVGCRELLCISLSGTASCCRTCSTRNPKIQPTPQPSPTINLSSLSLSIQPLNAGTCSRKCEARRRSLSDPALTMVPSISNTSFCVATAWAPVVHNVTMYFTTVANCASSFSLAASELFPYRPAAVTFTGG